MQAQLLNYFLIFVLVHVNKFHGWLIKGDIRGCTQYHNTIRKIGKYRNIMSKMDKILIPHLDPFKIMAMLT